MLNDTNYLVWDVTPEIFSVGGITPRWYGILFALAFLLAFHMMRWMYKRENRDVNNLNYLLWYSIIGAIIGARLGHCLFYDPLYYLQNPLKIFAVWEGGLASHGGIIGVLLGAYFYKRKIEDSYLWLLDRIVLPAVLGGFFIRMGNLFNSEIVGIPATVPWAVIFKRIDSIPRHPVQVYEALSYALIFVCLMYIYKHYSNRIKDGLIFGLAVTAVFTTRFFLEFVKTRQAHYAAEFGLSVGQMLSLPFILLGVWLVLQAWRRRAAE